MQLQAPRKVPGHERGLRQPKPFKRKVHLNVGVAVQGWTYQVHSEGIRVRSPDGKTDYVHYNDLCFTGRYHDPDDDYNWTITPSFVKAYVQTVYIDKVPWDFAKHAGGIYICGVLVYHDALTAKTTNDQFRWDYLLPLLIPLSKAGKNRWFDIEAFQNMLATSLGRSSWGVTRVEAVDRMASLLADGWIEHDRPLGQEGIQFRLKQERRQELIERNPQVAIFNEEDDGRRAGRLQGATLLSLRWDGLRQKFSVPRKGTLVSIDDKGQFQEWCFSLGLNPRITDRY